MHDENRSAGRETADPRVAMAGDQRGWSRILAATGSPLKLFALTVLVCNSVFALAAAWLGSIEAFIYTIHTFLAIVSAFTLTALWSPSSLYHPRELAELERLRRDMPELAAPAPPDRPWVPTLVVAVGLIGYTIYQLVTD